MNIRDVFVCDFGVGRHRYVVMGVATSPFRSVLLVMATSKIQQRKRFADRTNLVLLDSLVEVVPSEYQSEWHREYCSLNKPTCFDCNDPIDFPVQSIRNPILCDPISDELFARMLRAVRMSPSVEQGVRERFGLL